MKEILDWVAEFPFLLWEIKLEILTALSASAAVCGSLVLLVTIIQGAKCAI